MPCWFGLVLCLLMAGLAWKVTPTFEEMGAAALGLALVALTAVGAVSGAAVGLLHVYDYLAQPEVLADAQKYREALAVGHREALGNVPFGLILALVQAMVLALAWRRTSDTHL